MDEFVAVGAPRRARAALLAAVLLAAGCTAPGLTARHRALAAELVASEGSPGALPPPGTSSADDPFAGAATLEREALARRGAAAQPEPPRRALRLARGPRALPPGHGPRGSDARLRRGARRAVRDGAHRVDLRQAFPFPGKLRLRGEIALAEAEAAAHDFAAVRLRLATMASLLFDDYYLAARALEVNHHHRGLIDGAPGRGGGALRVRRGLRAGAAPGRVRARRARARGGRPRERARVVATAQLNGLLHRDPGRAAPAAAPRRSTSRAGYSGPRARGRGRARGAARAARRRRPGARRRGGGRRSRAASSCRTSRSPRATTGSGRCRSCGPSSVSS